MKFRTELEIKKSAFPLSPERPVALVGSCFADNIAGRMRECLWDARNPLGVLFNPFSIATALKTYILDADEASWRDTLFESNGLIFSWLSDSSGATRTVDDSAALFRRRSATLREALSEAVLCPDAARQGSVRREGGSTMIVTFGTSFCYFLADRPDFAVANCHKQPQSKFIRRRVDVAEILDVWRPLLRDLRSQYPDLRVIFTVSPVRHLRDGFHDNTLSKAILHLAVESLCAEFEWCEYFPAYELLTDDLRDYRFYADDLVHPSHEAVEYIWEKFKEAYIDPAGLEFLREGESLNRRLTHRPILPDTPEARQFAARTALLLADFHRRHPSALHPSFP